MTARLRAFPGPAEDMVRAARRRSVRRATRSCATVLLAVIVVTVTACSSTADPAVDREGGAGVDETTATGEITVDSYASSSLGFSIRLPAGWVVSESAAEWMMGEPPHRDYIQFDTLKAPADDPWMVFGRMPVDADVSLSEWIMKLRRTETITYPTYCDPATSAGTMVLDGERARMVGLRCPRGYGYPKSIALQVMALRARFGYFVMCFSEESENGSLPRLTHDCRRWLSSFRFTD